MNFGSSVSEMKRQRRNFKIPRQSQGTTQAGALY